ncbi:ATP-dependent helicase [Billgrantia lactosivorans]|uniref:ATP-dependent helicase n=1 Tax=Billgrantia lactosivorans TaxID=2185141 RepID=UPI000DAB5C95|nr:ATP-dependent helicase [Halomonas lactosivorans]
MHSSVELSPQQKAIVFAENGPIYVKASAGSGKTRVLTERVRFLLGKTNKKILALTFTNKAGQEIKERLSEIEDIEKRSFIGTFHGFCQSVLENHGNLIGYMTMPHIFEDEADRLELIEQAVNQVATYASTYKGMSAKDKKDFRYRALAFISKVKRGLISEEDIGNHTDNENTILLYRNYQDILRSLDAIDFDDLLLCAYKVLTSYPKVARLYQRSFYAICVDEAQDLNNAQYNFLRAVVNPDEPNIMLVGDPNQSIFHFNGSSPDFMDVNFVRDFSPEVIELTENYRSSIAVLDAARKLVPEAEYYERMVKPGVFELHAAENEKIEAEWVANRIFDIVSAGKYDDIEGQVTYERIAVLARNKYLFKPLEESLTKAGLPFYYKMTPGAVKFESRLLYVFDLAMRLKLNPRDDLHRSRLFKELGVDCAEQLHVEDITDLVDGNEMKQALELVLSLKDDGSNLKKCLEEFKSKVIVGDDNERAMVYNDVDELLVHWVNYAKQTGNKSLHKFKNAMALGQTHPLTQHSGVTLSTVHTMKGQEFDVVFIIGLDDETFPDYRAVRKGGVELTQEKNNLYVAFTRSKRWLFATWPENRLMPWGDYKRRSVSRFLRDFDSKKISA